MKAGWKTTEFWGRAIATAAGLGVAGGFIRPETGALIQQTTDAAIPILQMVIDGVLQLTGLIGALVLQYHYGRERAALKQTEARRQAG